MSSKKIFEAYGRFIVKRPWIVIGISLLFILVSICGMTMVYMEAGEEGVIDENTEEYKNYKKYTDNFGGTQKLFVIVTTEDVLQLDILQAIDNLEINLNRRGEYVTNVISISTVMKMAMFEYSGMEMLPHNQTIADMIFLSLPKDTVANLVPDEQHALVIVDITDDIDKGIDAVESALKETDFPDDVKTKIVGESIYYNNLTEEMKNDMTITMGAAIVLMMVILWLVFGHVKLRLLPLLMVLIGVLWTLGLMGFADIPITIIVITVFPILIGLGIDYSINFQNRSKEEFERGTPENAIIETIKHMGPAIGIALIATCLGFGTLLISVMPMISNFGLMCVFGVILCYVSAFSLLPAILFLYQRRKTQTIEKIEIKKAQNPRENRIEKIFYSVSGKTSKHPWPIFIIAVILAVGGLIAGSYLEVVVDFEDLAPEDMDAIQDLNELRDMVGGTEEFIIMVETDNITDTSLMEWMCYIEDLEADKHEGITEATSIASYIKKINNNTLPSNNEMLFFMMNRIPEKIRKGLINDDYSLAVIKVKIQHLGNEEKEDIYNTLKADIESHPAGIDVCVTGAPVIILKTADALTGNRDTLTIVGCILIFCGLLVIYRRLTLAVIPVVPIILVIGWSMGLMYILGISFNPLTACLGALIIGLGAEYTILLMERYNEERDKGKDPTMAIQVATSKIGRAIFSSGLTTMGGFGVLMIASFPFIREFGFVIVMDVALCLLSSLIVLPPLIVTIDKWKIKRAKKKEKITKTIKCPSCGETKQVQGRIGDRVMVTCSKCNSKGFFQFR